MKRIALATALLLMAVPLFADGGTRYWVNFRDRGLSAEQFAPALDQARASFTPKNFSRRVKSMPALVDEYDLPVNPTYISQINQTGAHLRTASRYLNAVSIEATLDEVARIEALPFVKSVEPFRLHRMSEPVTPTRRGNAVDELVYGPSYTQYELCHVPELHQRGLSGHGVIVCFLDSGYELTHEAFDSLRILARFDFIHGDTIVNDVAGRDSVGQSSHGTATLSTCGGFRDSMLVAPAYGATFLCAKTEWVPTETPVEEDYYVAALEWADSLGADITSSSLGYTDWYTWPDMNGHTAVTTRGLEVAASHGILCCTAAGNARFSTWNHIVAPADADSILACGAVDSARHLAGFSSPGPTYDGRIKPDVSAMGVDVFCADGRQRDAYFTLSGTSLSTPIVSGIAALVMEAHPEWTAQQVRAAMKNTASQATQPDNDLGWGILDAVAAVDYQFEDVPATRDAVPRSNVLLSSYPNPVNGTATITLSLPASGSGRLVMYDLEGREAFTWTQQNWSLGDNHLALNTSSFATGIYFVRFSGSMGVATQKIAILK